MYGPSVGLVRKGHGATATVIVDGLPACIESSSLAIITASHDANGNSTDHQSHYSDLIQWYINVPVTMQVGEIPGEKQRRRQKGRRNEIRITSDVPWKLYADE